MTPKSLKSRQDTAKREAYQRAPKVGDRVVGEDLVQPGSDDRTADLTRQHPHIFLDCDGVLADFDAHGLAYFGKPPRQAEAEIGSEMFWRRLESLGDFYRSLPLMADARELYAGVAHLGPTILTGCPKGDWAQGQKVAWAEEHFPGVPIITCRSSEKISHAERGDVLIDDWPQHRHRWIAGGGHFISHFDAKTSLAALFAHYPNLRRAPLPSVAAQAPGDQSREVSKSKSQEASNPSKPKSQTPRIST